MRGGSTTEGVAPHGGQINWEYMEVKLAGSKVIYRHTEVLKRRGQLPPQLKPGFIKIGHQFSFITISSGPLTTDLRVNPVSNPWRTAGEIGMACPTFSKVEALDVRGRRCAMPEPRSKVPRCGAEEGTAGRGGKGGKGVEGGGLAPRMMRRDL